MPTKLRLAPALLALALSACGGSSEPATAPQAAALELTGLPASLVTGAIAPVTITARDAQGSVATGYRGTVHLSSTDPSALLPADVTFTAADAGRRELQLVLTTPGAQSVTATDVAAPALHASASGLVVAQAGHLIGGAVVGLAGAGLTLSMPGQGDLVLPDGATSFVFGAPAAPGSSYQISIAQQPSPAQACRVMNGAGVVGATDVTDVSVRCWTTWRQVAAGGSHSLGLRTDGTAWAWGANGSGQVGDGGTTDRPAPVLLGNGFVAVAAGMAHSLGLKADGTLWAWGDNGFGQLGDGTTDGRLSPVQVLDGVASIGACTYDSLAVKADGTLWAWGDNSFGQLVNGTTIPEHAPRQVGPGFAAAACGYGFVLALDAGGAVLAAGTNGFGELGDGTTTDRHTLVQAGSGFASVTAGGSHALAIRPDATLWGWGSNGNGELGDGTTDGHLAPVQVGTGFAAVSTSWFFTLGLKVDGTLWTWGLNNEGELADGTLGGSRSSPGQAGTGFASAAAGGNHALAVKGDGSLWAWGLNTSGQLGDGTTTLRSTPVVVAGSP